MISGRSERRRREFGWSVLASIVLHVALIGLLLTVAAKVIIPNQGARERVSRTTIAWIEHRTPATPHPSAKRAPVRAAVAPAATLPRHELARIRPNATPQPAAHRHATSLATRIATDRRTFADEVARLNAGNDPNAIPTIDPATQQSAMKSFRMNLPDGTHAQGPGNGLITTTRRWTHDGQDCYYGHYEYTYGDGSVESADIAWPFCYDPAVDPFRLPPHPIPMPLPIAGYRLPPGTRLPPLERDVYREWLAAGG